MRNEPRNWNFKLDQRPTLFIAFVLCSNLACYCSCSCSLVSHSFSNKLYFRYTYKSLVFGNIILITFSKLHVSKMVKQNKLDLIVFDSSKITTIISIFIGKLIYKTKLFDSLSLIKLVHNCFTVIYFGFHHLHYKKP